MCVLISDIRSEIAIEIVLLRVNRIWSVSQSHTRIRRFCTINAALTSRSLIHHKFFVLELHLVFTIARSAGNKSIAVIVIPNFGLSLYALLCILLQHQLILCEGVRHTVFLELVVVAGLFISGKERKITIIGRIFKRNFRLGKTKPLVVLALLNKRRPQIEIVFFVEALVVHEDILI